ncbi:MAG TPA: hypothetical protein GXX26_06650 [Clostridiaceae bacterium]|nr:hypothetical protein [Clostridiaceae bacterium]
MIRRSKKGMAMIITLIVIFVFTVLGAVIWQYGINSVKQADKSSRQKQAYYLARSGAEAIYSHMINETDTAALKNKIDKILDIASVPVNIEDGSFTVTLRRKGSVITIESVGYFKGETASAALEIKETIDTGMPPNIFKNAIFATGSITLNGNVDIIGSLESSGKITINGSSRPEFIENSPRTYPGVIFPQNNSSTKLAVEKNTIRYIDTDGFYDEINVDKDGILQFNLSGRDLTVVANNIIVSGEIKIQGTGRLVLYAKNLKTSSNHGEINISNESLPIESFLVLMPPAGANAGIFDVNRFRGLLYAPGAKVRLHGNDSFTGAMIAGEVTNSGNTDVTYINDAGFITESYFEGITEETVTIRYEKGKWK